MVLRVVQLGDGRSLEELGLDVFRGPFLFFINFGYAVFFFALFIEFCEFHIMHPSPDYVPVTSYLPFALATSLPK